MNKKILLVTLICAGVGFIQTFAQKGKKEGKEEKAENLKVLPKNISGEELHNIMKGYAQSLGVRCNHCHVSHEVEGEKRPKFDFASDEKPEKNIARDMMKMVKGINRKYIGKMGDERHPFQQVTCVTCHNGRIKPIASVDSLKPRETRQ
jgi:thioredoxin reductase